MWSYEQWQRRGGMCSGVNCKSGEKTLLFVQGSADLSISFHSFTPTGRDPKSKTRFDLLPVDILYCIYNDCILCGKERPLAPPSITTIPSGCLACLSRLGGLYITCLNQFLRCRVEDIYNSRGMLTPNHWKLPPPQLSTLFVGKSSHITVYLVPAMSSESDLQSVLESLQMNDYLSRMVAHFCQ